MKIGSLFKKKKYSSHSLILGEVARIGDKKKKTRKRNTSGGFFGGISLSKYISFIKYLFIFILILGCVGIVAFLPVLRISSSSLFIFRSDTLIDLNRAYESLEYIRGEHILSIDQKSLSERLKRSQPWIQEVQFSRTLPNKVSLQLRSYSIIFQTENDLILESGSILPKNDKKYIGIPSLTVKNPEGITLGVENFHLSEKYLQKILSLKEKLKKDFPFTQTSEIIYYTREQEVLIVHPRGSVFIFDLSGNIENQIKKMNIFHNEYSNINETTFIYIDLRVPQKIHSCSLESEFNCRSTLKSLYGEKFFSP